jgi:hypothetical protein
VSNLLEQLHITSWINFLQAIIKLPEIPLESIFKARALQLLSSMLDPLAKLSEIIKSKDDLNVSDELIDAVNLALNAIMELIPLGFRYDKLSDSFASKFVESMEQYPSIFLSETLNCVRSYNSLLVQDVSSTTTQLCISIN